MSLDELNTEQKIMVKQALLTDKANAEGRDVSMSELDKADSLVSDEELYEKYDGVYFVPDDFFITA